MGERKRSTANRTVAIAHDVAKLAGVSQAAVSRAFTPGASISAPMRKKILEAAKTLGYRPNLLARSLTSGRSNLIGMGVGKLANPFFAEALELFSIALERAGFRLLLFPINEVAVVKTEISEVLHYRLDALVLLSTTLSSELATQCRTAKVPVVLFNRLANHHDISSVISNNEVGGASVAAFLHGGHHKRPAIIAGMAESSTSQQRERGFTDFYASAGLPPPIVERGEFDFDKAAAATRRLLTRPDRPDAIFCVNDFMALAALNVARFEFGLLPGRDISIVGFDDVPQSSWPAFALTSFAQPTSRMVESTVDIIRQLQEDPEQTHHVVVEGQMVVRASARLPDAGV